MLSGIFLLMASAWGLEGHFVYQGDQQTVSTVRRETVYTPSPQGQVRLKELKSEGYSCAAKLQFVQCSLSLEPESLKDSFVPSAKDVLFGPVTALNTKYEGEGLVQYEAFQNITVNGFSFSKAMYYEFKDFVKISVGSPEQSNYFSFVVGKNSITAMEQVTKTESRWVYKTHWVEATLQQL